MEIPVPDGPDINIGGQMMRIIWTLYAITIIVVGIRLYTQWKVARQPGLGDAMMALSVVSGICLCCMLSIQHHYGLGRHFYFLDNHQRIYAIKFNFIGQAFGIMAPTFGRMACVVLMMQLFATTPARRWGLWFMFWQSLVVNGVTLILVFAQCEDVQTLWDAEGHPGSCWSATIQEYTGFAQGAINAATDLFLTVLPTTIFWNLQISLKLKLGLGFLLGLSIFAFVACIIKTVLLQSLGERGDFTFNTVPFFTWVVVECTLVNIAASVPLIRPLFTQQSRKKKSDAYEFSDHYTGPTNSKKGVRIGSREGDLEATIDNSSEENILPMGDRGVNGSAKSIVKETRYTVSYDNDTEGPRSDRPTSGHWISEPSKTPWENQQARDMDGRS